MIKLFIVGVLCAFGSAVASAQADAPPIDVHVDERVELISIVFRLAGNPEYGQGRVDRYIADVKEHFGPFWDHTAPLQAANLRKTRGVSYDAPMSLAVHLDGIANLRGRVPLDPLPEAVDARWRPDELERFLREARRFVEESDAAAFFEVHRPFYEETARRLGRLLQREARLEWFDAFFGAKPAATFTVIPALVNGGSCYGPHARIDGVEELYCVLGVWQTDAEGLPDFDRGCVDTVIHEFSHSYVNPVVDAHADAFAPSGERIFPHVKDEMQRIAYGSWRTVLYESLVRAAVIRYLRTTEGRGAAGRQVLEEEDRGFAWMGELADLFDEYEADRETYPSFDSFVPRIVAFFDAYAGRFDEEMKADAANRPKVVSLSPENGAAGVSPNTTELRVTFDRPMKAGFSWCGGGAHYPEVPDGQRPHWTADRKTCVLPVRLKPNWRYTLGLNSPSYTGFTSAEGVSLKPVAYTFATAASSE